MFPLVLFSVERCHKTVRLTGNISHSGLTLLYYCCFYLRFYTFTLRSNTRDLNKFLMLSNKLWLITRLSLWLVWYYFRGLWSDEFSLADYKTDEKFHRFTLKERHDSYLETRISDIQSVSVAFRISLIHPEKYLFFFCHDSGV